MDLRRNIFLISAVALFFMVAIYYYTSTDLIIRRHTTGDAPCPVGGLSLSSKDQEEQRRHFLSTLTRHRDGLKNPKEPLHNIQMYITPQIDCPTVVRIGNLADGGKWVCNPWRIQDDCVVYSLGVNGDTSFEQEFYDIIRGRCRIICVDMGQENPEIFKSFNGRFFARTVSNVTNKATNEVREIAGRMPYHNLYGPDYAFSENRTIRHVVATVCAHTCRFVADSTFS